VEAGGGELLSGWSWE